MLFFELCDSLAAPSCLPSTIPPPFFGASAWYFAGLSHWRCLQELGSWTLQVGRRTLTVGWGRHLLRVIYSHWRAFLLFPPLSPTPAILTAGFLFYFPQEQEQLVLVQLLHIAGSIWMCLCVSVYRSSCLLPSLSAPPRPSPTVSFARPLALSFCFYYPWSCTPFLSFP